MDRTSERREAAQTSAAQESDLRAQGFLSRAHQHFAEYIEGQPEEFLRLSYASLCALDDSTLCRAQPWPVFLPLARAEMFESAAVGLARILLDLPRRIFDNDPARFEEFYQLDEDQARLIATLIHATDILSSATARGDFVETADGLKCLEFNVGGGLGGWSVGAWTRTYLANPLIRGFLESSGLEVTWRIPAQVVFRHILEEAGPLADQGEFNVAFVVPAEEMLTGTGCWAEDYEREYRTVLASRPDLTGSATTCCITELHEGRGGLRFRDRRIHAVVEACDGNLTLPVISALVAGTVRVYNGPVNRVLGDKLNLALLSELVDSDLLNSAEQETVRAHVPWTRRVSAEFVDWKGERAYLPDLLCEQQEKMVVKAGYSAHGDEVFIGPATPRQAWVQIVGRALENQGWVVQEFLQGTTYDFQVDDDPQRPTSPHDLIWGLLTYGEQYAGCFVRLMARGGHGVINAARGACVGAVLEVDEGPS